jgi:hypothetical protein
MRGRERNADRRGGVRSGMTLAQMTVRNTISKETGPWEVRPRRRHCFVLDVPKEHFDDAPGFDKDHWPSTTGEQWHRELHAYYRTPLYWE